MKNKKIGLYLFFLIVVSLGIYYLGSRIRLEDITRVVEDAGVWAPVLYSLILTLTYVIAPLSGTPVFLAGYFLFGRNVQFLNYFACLLGAVINFWIARRFGRGVVSKLVGERNISKVDRFTENYGVKSLIFLRLLQGQFHDFIAYAYGLTNMKFVPYFIVSVLAPIPWFLLWYFYIFNQIENVRDLSLWLLITVAPFFVISAFLIRKLRK